jgi:hypothetical protein
MKQETFAKLSARHRHPGYFERPFFSRRRFFELLGTGVAGSYLLSRRAQAADVTRQNISLINKAENVIFILLTGAISHTDTFDLKVVNGTTPASFNATKINGVDWPSGLLPKMGQQFSDIALVRSVKSWALVHNLAQVWSQIGRNPAAALGDIAPNIGSIVAIEKERERQVGQVFPSFLALNANTGVGSGYLSTKYAPFRFLTPGTASAGLPNTTNTAGQTRFEAMYGRMQALDGGLRKGDAIAEYADYDQFYQSAKGMMYNSAVQQAFSFSQADSARYGSSAFGNSCLVAKKVLEAKQGTRFIQINFGNWDHHQDIYSQANLLGMAKQLDDGYSMLLSDLKAAGLLDKTLVFMTGEFGRTVGRLNGSSGRDHWPQQTVLFAGAGVKGGRALGATDATGALTATPGWSRNREVRPEDIEATIYSAMGIDYTTIRYDDPFGRGFEYVPFSGEDLYGPIQELWSA